ncbi:MAG: methyltransferase domain-containing protein [Bacteroidetes bacterium]|nr:MAG: methyltransferase domain-containing protein [Bacteroidota bacterium]
MNELKWNRLRYSFYAPIYDWIAGIFNESRRKSIEALNLQAGQKVLLVGAGTGLDLPYIPEGVEVLATDLTPAMLEKCKSQKLATGVKLETRVMDGQNLELEDTLFDAVILHLIVAVIPEPVACLNEADRVLKPGGQIAVFDKFNQAKTTGILRRILNKLTHFLFSDITRNFYTLSEDLNWKVLSDKGANFGGNFRIIKAIKVH